LYHKNGKYALHLVVPGVSQIARVSERIGRSAANSEQRRVVTRLYENSPRIAQR
jgi:hypothetical protein